MGSQPNLGRVVPWSKARFFAMEEDPNAFVKYDNSMGEKFALRIGIKVKDQLIETLASGFTQ